MHSIDLSILCYPPPRPTGVWVTAAPIQKAVTAGGRLGRGLPARKSGFLPAIYPANLVPVGEGSKATLKALPCDRRFVCVQSSFLITSAAPDLTSHLSVIHVPLSSQPWKSFSWLSTAFRPSGPDQRHREPDMQLALSTVAGLVAK